MRYDSDYDDQEPTPLQEMREEWRQEVAGLQEQIDEAVRLLSQLRDPHKPKGTNAFLDQNTKPKSST
jgi:hypothetical protein